MQIQVFDTDSANDKALNNFWGMRNIYSNRKNAVYTFFFCGGAQWLSEDKIS